MKRSLLCIVLCLFAYCHAFANLTQGHWRWHNNNGTEATATWKADQDSTITITDYKAIRLRAEVYNNTGNAKTVDRGLKYATSPSGPWYNISNISAINAFVFGGDNTYIHHGDATSAQITGSTYGYVPGIIITREDGNVDNIPNQNRLEYEWCIKPTAHILPNTTYFFKSGAGDLPGVLPSLTTSGSNFTSGPQPILSNGGFESELTDWTTTTLNGSAAAFTITNATNFFHTGAKALAVTVTNAGPSNSVTLSSGTVTLKDTGTYLLRFWAIADQRNALLDIELKSAAADDLCHYQIYDRFDKTKNGWQMYQYAFKVTQGPVTLNMRFNSNTTYYLDDIEIINDITNPNIDVTSQYVWQNNFYEPYGWLSGDNNNPVLLPDSTVAWVYNDSFMGINNPNSNVLGSSRIINNLVVKRSGDSLTSIYKGTAPNSQALFSPGNGNLFWQSGGIIENNSLKILLIEISNGNYAGRSWVGTLSLPDLQVVSLNRLPATINVNPNCIMSDGDYNYIYFGQSTGTFEMHTIVARVPIGQFDSQTPWEYYTGDSTWSTDYTNAKNIVEGVAAGNVMKLGENNYVMAGVPHLSSEIDAWFAPTPYGPWGDKTVIYHIPQQEGILAYEGHLDPVSRDGDYTFTYSVYPFVNEPDGSSGSVPMQIAVKSTYVPIYAKANLLQLSPYTSAKSSDSLISFTGEVAAQTVQLNWRSAQVTDDHYEVQRSTDGNTWVKIASVAGADSVSIADYTSVDNNPVNGVNYYRLAIYNLDSKVIFSDLVAVRFPIASIISFTGQAVNQDVQLNWEIDNNNIDHFIIQHSTNGTDFTNSVTVAGSDSITDLHYQAIETGALNNYNYYRIEMHDLDGRITFSPVITVSSALSVRLIDFTAMSNGPKKVRLNWSTASEQNNNLFTIERSQDNNNFVTLATIAGAGTTSTLSNYKYFDQSPLDGVNYYRLSYLSNGKEVTSAVRSVNMGQKMDLRVHPNPTHAPIKFILRGYEAGSFQAILSNLSGRVIASETYKVVSSGVYSFQNKPTPGIYILKLTGNGLSISAKVVVAK